MHSQECSLRKGDSAMEIFSHARVVILKIENGTVRVKTEQGIEL